MNRTGDCAAANLNGSTRFGRINIDTVAAQAAIDCAATDDEALTCEDDTGTRNSVTACRDCAGAAVSDSIIRALRIDTVAVSTTRRREVSAVDGDSCTGSATACSRDCSRRAAIGTNDDFRAGSFSISGSISGSTDSESCAVRDIDTGSVSAAGADGDCARAGEGKLACLVIFSIIRDFNSSINIALCREVVSAEIDSYFLINCKRLFERDIFKQFNARGSCIADLCSADSRDCLLKVGEIYRGSSLTATCVDKNRDIFNLNAAAN